MLFRSSTEGRERDDVVALYNNGGKLDVLSITDAAKEGVDLLGTRTMHVAESAQNLHSENQTMSRVARFGSHSRLPLDQQKVTFVKYHSIFPTVEQLEKQRKELETYFEEKYKLPVKGEFDIVKTLAQLFKQLENGETVDEQYARTNLEKAKLLIPWLDMLKRVGDRKETVAKKVELQQAEERTTVTSKKLTVEEIQQIQQSLVIKKADKTPIEKKRKSTEPEKESKSLKKAKKT